MTLGEKIRTLRKNAQLSQEALAEQLDVSRQAVSKWENDNGLPENEKLIKMAKLFHVSLDTFINDAEDIAPAASAASAEDEQLSLAAAEGYLDFRCHRCQRVGLAVLLLIASLGLTFFLSDLVMLLLMLIDIVAIAQLILVAAADNPYKELKQQSPLLSSETRHILMTRYTDERPRLQRELFLSIICIGIGLLLLPLLFPADWLPSYALTLSSDVADNLALASGMVLTGFGTALCIFSVGRIRAYRHLLGTHSSTSKE